MNSRNQSYVVYLLLFIAIIVLVVYSVGRQNSAESLTLNQVAGDIKSGLVSKIEEDENKLSQIINELQKDSNIKEIFWTH